MFELEGYTMPDFPERDEGQYPIAVVSLDSSGGCAYLTFADKAGYIKKLIAGDVWTGNAYTLGLTPEDTYDESKVIYEQSYVVMLDEAYKDALELLYPGITTTAWLRYTPPSTQTPSGGYYSLAMNYGPQWTNTDLYDEDGNLFLSAAGKKFPIREWLSWRIYGLCSRPLPMGARVPVAYLYNGVRLPGLPENAKNYSCLVISETYGSGFYEKIGTTQLCLLSKPCVYNADDITLVPEDGTTVSFEKYTINKYTESEWKQGTGLTDNPVCNIYSPLVWANFNVYDTAGNLVLSASEPVPVYE